jgi:curli biogenesis system outer membrane secretion channel CsgG
MDFRAIVQLTGESEKVERAAQMVAINLHVVNFSTGMFLEAHAQLGQWVRQAPAA